ncbi:unnamed protein product [Cercopithifilaria johnstoni]|uniref:Uncharacterized protein n=1 Tax=Cercopithifilaria johnstoni TaxID=2874296 RepID=A0A8J2MK30_9BILA|nr:unnamed protein product [Cercopithifilaria johnstoni]
MVAASTVVSAKDRLPSCELIPKLLCSTEHISNKCLVDCINYVVIKCPYKMQNYDEIITMAIAPTYQTAGDYIYLNQQQLIIISVSNSNFSSDIVSRIENSRPFYSPCLQPKLVDKLFLTRCQHHVPANCHNLCTYEHREHIAVPSKMFAILNISALFCIAQIEIAIIEIVASFLVCYQRN